MPTFKLASLNFEANLEIWKNYSPLDGAPSTFRTTSLDLFYLLSYNNFVYCINLQYPFKLIQ